jgi:hypothetical protein
MSLFLAISTFPLHTLSPQFVRYDDVFTTFHADIPDGKRFLQETLPLCAGLGASVQVGGAKTVEVSGHLPILCHRCHASRFERECA